MLSRLALVPTVSKTGALWVIVMDIFRTLVKGIDCKFEFRRRKNTHCAFSVWNTPVAYLLIKRHTKCLVVHIKQILKKNKTFAMAGGKRLIGCIWYHWISINARTHSRTHSHIHTRTLTRRHPHTCKYIGRHATCTAECSCYIRC